MDFIVADCVAEIVHHNPREETGFFIFSDKIIFDASAPENTGMNTKHGDNAVVFGWASGVKNLRFRRDEAVWHEFLDFCGVWDLIKEECTIRFDYKRHFGGGFRGISDKLLLEPNWELGKFGLHIMRLADHHRIDELLDAFGIL